MRPLPTRYTSHPEYQCQSSQWLLGLQNSPRSHPMKQCSITMYWWVHYTHSIDLCTQAASWIKGMSQQEASPFLPIVLFPSRLLWLVSIDPKFLLLMVTITKRMAGQLNENMDVHTRQGSVTAWGPRGRGWSMWLPSVACVQGVEQVKVNHISR
jgi:hypothetical protein